MKFNKTLIVLMGLALPALGQPDPAILKEGQVQFAACVACHGPDGRGVKADTLVMAPSLFDSKIVQGDPSVLALIILKGIKKETPEYVQQMLALESVLDDQKMADVLTYVRHTFGGHKDTIRAKQVQKWRKQFSKIPPAMTRGAIEGMVIKANGVKHLVKDLTWKEYQGSWKKLPDFKSLKPINEGTAKNGLIDIGVTKAKESLGMVFTSTLMIPKEDTYEFATASDDGSDLWINGKRVVDNGGIHPLTVKSGKIKLPAGEHRMMVRYFEGGGQEDLMVSIKAKSIGGEISLSKKKISKGGGGSRQQRSIPIQPEIAGEAIMYRNFIAGSNPRGIAVGYPGGLNICWDADVMNLVMLWRGEFMDAGRHWNGRGAGSQPPAGTDVVKIVQGFPLMELNSPEKIWPNEAFKVAYAYAKDSAERKSEKTFIGRHPDYRFVGYELDKKRFPTFKYTFKNLSVTDGFQPQGADISRTLNFSGKAGPNTLFRISSEANQTPDGLQASGMNIKVDGTEIRMRNKEAFIPITSPGKVTITYAWENPPETETL